jgi:type I restriction enzyme S subunit
MSKSVKIKDICEFKRGLTYSKSDEVDFSNNVVVRATNIELKNNRLNLAQLKYIKDSIKIKEDKILKKGDILICTASGSKSHLGKVAFIDKDINMAFGGFMGVLRTSKKCLPKFLYNILISQKFKKVLLSNTSGSNINNLRFSQIENFEFILPSLLEQQRIIAKLDEAFAEIDNAIELTKKNISNFKSYYSYTIDKEFSKYSDKTRQIGDYSKINYGYTAKANFDKGSYKLLRITDIQNNSVDWNTVPCCNVEPNKLSSVILKHGDIVFARTGATTGKSFLIQNPVNSVFASYLIRISVDREILLPMFVMYYFQSAKYWKQVNDGISGSAQGGFNSSKLSQLRIPIISKANQQKLVEKFDLINEYSLKLQDYYSRKSIHLHSLKQAILSKELIRKNAA